MEECELSCFVEHVRGKRVDRDFGFITDITPVTSWTIPTLEIVRLMRLVFAADLLIGCLFAVQVLWYTAQQHPGRQRITQLGTCNLYVWGIPRTTHIACLLLLVFAADLLIGCLPCVLWYTAPLISSSGMKAGDT